MTSKEVMDIMYRIDINNIYNYNGNNGNISHYTSPIGLQNILKTKKLFFTRYDMLNDFSEGKELEKIYQKVCRDLLKEKKITKDQYQAFSKITVTMNIFVSIEIEPQFDEEKKELIPCSKGMCPECTPFVCSFCLDDDSIPMWNHYSKDDKYRGYSISYEPSYIFNDDYDKGYKLNLIKVIYDDQEKENCLKSHILRITDMANKTMINSSIQELLNFSFLVFKNKMFEYEKEVRAIFWRPNDSNIIEIEHRIVNSIPTPYIAVTINLDSIYSITVGPGINEIEARNGITSMIDSDTIIIKKSKAPLRY